MLIDVCMPDLDGFELAAMIREHPRFQKTAIIFVSAIQLTDLDRLRGYAGGAVDYVPVPVVPELLRAKVRVFAELYRKTRQLEQLNAELERRVAERTAELAQANAELEQRVEERTREREAALAQVHEMQKLESLGQLTGGVAHDFNNLLMAVLGNLELLRKTLPDDPRLLRLIDGAMQGADRGATLTKRMLAFARRQELRAGDGRCAAAGRRHGRDAAALARARRSRSSPTYRRRPAADPRSIPTSSNWRCSTSRSTRATRCRIGGRLTIVGARREPVAAGDVPGLGAGRLCLHDRVATPATAWTRRR